MSIHARIHLQKGAFILDAEFTVPGDGVTALFGRSGCGKSTLLRAIAGLEHPLPGSTISVNGIVWLEDSKYLSVHQRRVGYVFQDPGLFNHLRVRGNLMYGFKRKQTPDSGPAPDEVIAMLGLERFLDRYPQTLSGGERQRVAIGRALLSAPDLLLMDEPLAALDMKSRDEILPFLDSLCVTARMPVLYVSHSPDEVVRLAENLIVMGGGKVIAHGELADVLSREDSPIAQSDEAFSVLSCTVQKLDGPCHLSVLNTRSGESVFVPRVSLNDRTNIRLRINARDVSLCTQRPVGSSILNILEVQVAQIVPPDHKGQQLVRVRLRGTDELLLARISEYSCQELGVAENMHLYAQIKAVALIG